MCPSPRKPAPQARAAPVRPIYGKFQSVPSWADPANVLGYTYEFPLNDKMVQGLMQGQYSGTPYPTVYYRHGHRTVKHKTALNVGWEGGTNRSWRFFGNVHDKWLDKDYWKGVNHIGSKLTPSEKKHFAQQLLYAAAHPDLSQYPKICTSYFDPKTQSWANQPHRSEGLLAASAARLLEIFDDKGTVVSHPSRNRFRWAEANLRTLLHDLAVQGVP